MLIFPPFTQPKESKKRCLVPLGIAYIGAYLRKRGIIVSLLDCVVEGYDNDKIEGDTRTFGLSDEEIKIRVKEFQPSYVGVSCLMTAQRHNAYNVCKLAKEVDGNIHTVMGGIHPSVFPKQTLSNPHVDSVVVGEGEEAMLGIVKNRAKGIVRSYTLDINEIPWPARDLLPMERYLEINMPENIFSPNMRVTQMVTSRGCPFKCVFCATTRFHGKWRGRDAEDVVKEIIHLVDTYGIDEINFIDENLVLDRQRTMSIMSGMIELDIAWSNPGGIWINGLDVDIIRLMKQAGCYQLTFPIESSTSRILKDVINKPLDLSIVKPLVKECHRLGIDVHAFFIEGFPEQTRQEMINDFNYAKQVGFDSASFHIICPMPGSVLYERHKDDVDIDDINYISSSIIHPVLPKAHIEALVHKMNVRFNRGYKKRHPIKYFKKYVWIPHKKKFNKPLQRV